MFFPETGRQLPAAHAVGFYRQARIHPRSGDGIDELAQRLERFVRHAVAVVIKVMPITVDFDAVVVLLLKNGEIADQLIDRTGVGKIAQRLGNLEENPLAIHEKAPVAQFGPCRPRTDGPGKSRKQDRHEQADNQTHHHVDLRQWDAPTIRQSTRRMSGIERKHWLRNGLIVVVPDRLARGRGMGLMKILAYETVILWRVVENLYSLFRNLARSGIFAGVSHF